MTRSVKIPLPLFKVLEEEYIALHGLPTDNGSFTVKMPDSNRDDKPEDVVANFDWNFHSTHIKNLVKLAYELRKPKGDSPARPGGSSAKDPDVVAKNNLLRYLHTQPGFSELVLKGGPKGSLAVEPLVAEFNKLLLDSGLFKEDRFSIFWITSPTKTLIAARGSENFAGEDLAHFNRLLIEDAFPECFERIYTIRLAAAYQRIHEKRPAALCLSGGGIRSGTFALGLLQGFARHELLDKFHYLSTVSGADILEVGSLPGFNDIQKAWQELPKN